MKEKNDLKIIILIPVYNHPDTIRDVVIKTMSYHNEVMVVDDGSDWKVSDILSGLDVTVVRHTQNMGKGAAILTGAERSSSMGYTHIITIDADGQHDPGDLPKIIRAAEKNPNSIIVGKRNFEKTEVPGSSVFGRKFSNFWLRVQTGRSLGDTQSGFRAYPLGVLNELNLHEKHYSFEVEVLVKAIWSGINILEVDVNVYYPPGDKRITHFLKFKDNWRISLLNTKLTMRSVLPWPHRKIIFDKQEEKIVSIWHPVNSIKALLTENTSPEKIAFAGALGVFLGALPLIACHMVVIIMVSSFLRLNKVVALSTSQLCMPPFMPAICIEAGFFFRNGRFLTEISIDTIGYQAIQRIYEWLLGSLVIGPLAGILVGLLMFIMAVIIKKGRNGITRQ
jgi:glycosyltransferase involved in cell wall biosynthesis